MRKIICGTQPTRTCSENRNFFLLRFMFMVRHLSCYACSQVSYCYWCVNASSCAVRFAWSKTDSLKRFEKWDEGIALASLRGEKIDVCPRYDASRAKFFTGRFLILESVVGIIDIVEPDQNPCTNKTPEGLVESSPENDHQGYRTIKEKRERYSCPEPTRI